MKNKRIILNFLVIISVIIGLISTFVGASFMSKSMLCYFTIQSNILIGIVSLVFLVFDLIKKRMPNILYLIKYIATVGITITFLVYNLVLVPQMYESYGGILQMYSLSSCMLHLISPLCAILGFILFDKNFKYKKYYIYFSVLMPILYLIFCFIIGVLVPSGIFSGSKFPYFFLDYETYGWFTINKGILQLGVMYWYLIILLISLLIGKILIFLNRR